MLILGPIGFTSPLLLWGIMALPILWLLLRAVPPAPIRRRFPGVALLLGLADDENQADRTPWWLLVLRMLAVALVIAGFAGPVLSPEKQATSTGPLLILTDGSWADARDWPQRQARMISALAEARRSGRPVALLSLTDLPPGGPVFAAADAVAAGLPAVVPQAWEPDLVAMEELASALPEGGFETLWLSDGLARDGRETLLDALSGRGAVTVVESPRNVVAAAGAGTEAGDVKVNILRARTGNPATGQVSALGLDPAGIERELARVTVTFASGEGRAVGEFDLPPELRNRVTRFEIVGETTAGAVTLTDDALKRRKVALVAGGGAREGLELLSPDHFLRQALAPTADLIDGTIGDVLLARPDVIILADVAKVAETDTVLDWIDEGGLLVRFAGPQLAGSDIGRDELDPLLPVKLREGGRAVGGAMSWGEPKALARFADTSPFFGLPVPTDVSIRAQILAQPGPQLSASTIATLADGTPLVTRREIGDGQTVLFHVAANAEWSSLPLSGLFVQMLERLAVSSGTIRPSAQDLAGTVWSADRVLDGFGVLQDAGSMPGIPGERLSGTVPSRELPPGLYTSNGRQLAVNAVVSTREMTAVEWPSSVAVEGLGVTRETPLKGWFLAAALVLLLTDIVAALAVAGRLTGSRAGLASVVIGVFLAGLADTGNAQTSSDARVLQAAGSVVLAHVLTGDAAVDGIASDGLRGLSQVLYARTSVEPGEPMGVNLESDELSVFTFLYWPLTANQPLPSSAAYAKLNRYLRTGGMILFDTRDADVAGFGAASPEGRRLQAMTALLDIPPLEPLPKDHVLTRSFYLLQVYPGRFAARDVWVEAAPPDAEQAEGMPFRNLNDGVTPVVIGGNDWAGAWAIDSAGRPRLPVGRGLAGERQREIAFRFGVNLIMYALTGNYKSDQVHVPALLERLGQ